MDSENDDRVSINDDPLGLMAGIDPEAAKAEAGEQPTDAEAHPSTQVAKPDNGNEDAEQEDEQRVRDAKGRFIPLDRHESVLANARKAAEAEREAREKAEREANELREQLASRSKPLNDAEFEHSIEDYPENLQNTLRAQRAAQMDLQKRLDDSEAARAKEADDAQSARMQAEHAKALESTPVLKSVYADPDKAVMIDRISDRLMAQEGYKPASRADHYKAVEREYLAKYPSEATKAARSRGASSSAPPSLSAITGEGPAASTDVDRLEGLNPMELAAHFASLPNDAAIDRELRRLYG